MPGPGVCLVQGVCLVWGAAWSVGGVCSRGVPGGGVPGPGVSAPRGVCSRGGGVPGLEGWHPSMH